MYQLVYMPSGQSILVGNQLYQLVFRQYTIQIIHIVPIGLYIILLTGWWFQTFLIFHFIYGMSSFPLTNSYFSRWLFNHQPDTYRLYKSLNIDHFFIKSSRKNSHGIPSHISSNPHEFPAMNSIG